MKLRFLSVVAATLLLGACSSTADTTATTAGNGAANQGAVSATNAPRGPVPGSEADLVASAGDRVFFDFDKSALSTQARQTLDKQAAWLKRFPQVTVTIEGNCDERGTREYNLALGARRAAAAKNYLVSLGVTAARISTISYGKERPVALGHNEAAWAQNRNAITVVKGGPAS